MAVNFNENSLSIVNVEKNKSISKNNRVIAFKADNTEKPDRFEHSAPQVPEISTLRLMFGYLSKEQVDKVNEAGKLPPNAKFMGNGVGGYSIGNNFFGLRAGTRKIPEGFELKRNIFGFTVVVPKETEGLFIK